MAVRPFLFFVGQTAGVPSGRMSFFCGTGKSTRMREPAPIILTATMARADFAWADGLRRAHFPPERNVVPAHISLFHHLPPGSLAELTDLMREAAAGPAPDAMLTDVMSLGRGVAFRVESPGLIAIRQRIAERFHGLLTPQDQHKPRLHITVQNKVTSQEARALHGALAAEFRPRPIRIAGLAAWYYRGGPWEAIAERRFR